MGDSTSESFGNCSIAIFARALNFLLNHRLHALRREYVRSFGSKLTGRVHNSFAA